MLRFRNESGIAKMRFVSANNSEALHQWTSNAGWIASIAAKYNATLNNQYLQFRVVGSSNENSEAGLAAATKMTILGNGNVGIGTTSPTYKLDVAGGQRINMSTSTTVLEIYNTDTNDGNGVFIKAGGVNSTKYALVIQNAASTNLMTVLANGNVGIGTTTPAVKLEVSSDIMAGINSKIGFRYSADNNNYYNYITANGANPLTLVGGMWSQFGTVEGIRFLTYSGTAVSILNNGNVGIGTTSPPTKLSIFQASGAAVTADISLSGAVSAVNAGHSIDFKDSNNANSYARIAGVTNSTGITGELSLWTSTGLSTAATEKVRIDGNGNVGIGTAGPNSILEIASTTPVFRIQASSSVSFHGIEFRQGANLDAFIKQLPSTGEFRISNGRSVEWGGYMTFYTDITERMRITSAGNITMNSVVYNNTATGLVRTLSIGDNYTIGGLSSIRSSKTNIENITDVSWLNNLNPVKFNYRKKNEEGQYIDEYYDELSYGLIAEDVEPINDLLCNYDIDEDGNKKLIGIEYPRLIVPMLKLIQEQNQIINNLESRLKAIENN
jgi:hypothetical protein